MNKKIQKRKNLSEVDLMDVAGGTNSNSRFDVPSPKVLTLGETSDDFLSFNKTLQGIVKNGKKG